SRRRHTRFSRDWSSDVCSSDLVIQRSHPGIGPDNLVLSDRHTKVFRSGSAEVVDFILADTDLAEITFEILVGRANQGKVVLVRRSEERRVGKECRSRWCVTAYR